MKNNESSNVERLAGCYVTLWKIGLWILVIYLLLFVIVQLLEHI